MFNDTISFPFGRIKWIKQFPVEREPRAERTDDFVVEFKFSRAVSVQIEIPDFALVRR